MFKKSQWLTLYLAISFNSFAAEGLINVLNMEGCDMQLKNVSGALNKLTAAAAN